MSNISYIRLLQTIESFSSAHLQIQKFGSDFPGQMPNFATKDEGYPILFVSPTNSIFNQNTTTFEVDIYCWDIIQKDRANINTILSDTNQILSDLDKWYRDGDIYGIDLISSSTSEPLNNGLLDYSAGWKMRMIFDVNTYGVCEIPFSNPPTVITEVCDIVYSTPLTCETLFECPTIINIENNINDIRVDVNALSGNVSTINTEIADINTILGGLTGSTPYEVVYFDTINPNLSGTTFDPDQQQALDTLYVSNNISTPGQSWIWNGIAYTGYTGTTVNNTPFKFIGTTIDAGGNKTAGIERSGEIRLTHPTSGQTLQVISGVNGMYMRTSATSANKLYSYNTPLSVGTTTTHDIQLITNNTQRLYITSAGSIIFNSAYTFPKIKATIPGQVLGDPLANGTLAWVTPNKDIFVTGGTYSAGTATFVNNTGGTFNVTGFSKSIDTFTTGFTYNNANQLTISNSTGGTLSANISIVTGLTSTGLFVSNSISATTYYNIPQPSAITISYSSLSTLLSTSALTKDATYYITDRNIWIKALANNLLDLNAKRKLIIIKDSAYHGTGTLGVWNSALTPTINSKVIWGGQLWKNLTGYVGVSWDPTMLDDTNWLLITTDSIYYDKVFKIGYNFTNNKILVTKDNRGNEIYFDDNDGDLSIYCDWGNEYIYGNIATFISNNEGDCYIYDNHGDILSSTIQSNISSVIYGNIFKGSIKQNNINAIYRNINSSISQNSGYSSIYENEGASISSNTSTGYGYINNNTSTDISSNHNSRDISYNKINFITNNTSNVDSIKYNIGYMINLNSISNNILNNKTYIINSNASNVTTIQNNNNISISYNNNIGSIEYNSNNGEINSNTINGSINNNNNNGFISNNTSLASISYNSNDGSIDTNANSNVSSCNTIGGNIYGNTSNVDSIINNSGTGNISSNNNTLDISYNNVRNGIYSNTSSIGSISNNDCYSIYNN